MDECKHGLKHGCSHCHASKSPARSRTVPKRQTPSSRLAEQMNDRMTALNRRLRELRGE